MKSLIFVFLILFATTSYSQTGSIKAFAGDVAPSGYIFCDGASLDTIIYNDLFNVIGYKYGGSGSSFALPDLRGRVIVGTGSGVGLTPRMLNDTGGKETVTLLEDNLPAHNHPLYAESALATSGNPNGRMIATPDDGVKIYSNSVPALNRVFADETIGDTGSGAPFDNAPPFIVLNYIIKT